MTVNVPNRASLNLTGEPIVAPSKTLPQVAPVEGVPMERQACREYVQEMQRRYALAGRQERGHLLTECTAVTGYHRKYLIALMKTIRGEPRKRAPRGSRFSPETIRALIAIWRAADYPWSARLAALLPIWMPWARQHLQLDEAMQRSLLSMSARSMDRALTSHRTALKRRIYGRTKPGTLLKHQIPIRTDRWDVHEAGWCETDTVAHCGETGDGEFANSVNLTDVASTWTETRAVLGKGKRFVVEALEDMRQSMPFPLLGLDSDSGSEFINYHCFDWCNENDLQFTRSRPYHKNDNAHIEQKNWTHVRKVFGWKRIDAPEAIQAMNELYRTELRLFMNYFLPSVKLIERVRVGSRVRKKYDKPKTPFERLIELGMIAPKQLAEMTAQREALDPFTLSATIEAKVRRVLTIAHGVLPRKPSSEHRRLRDLTYSTKTAKKVVQRKNAPVRSYVAR